MAAPHAPFAARTAANGDIEFAVSRLDFRNLGLILLSHFHELHAAAAAAARAFIRQRRGVDFVDTRRHGANGSRTIIINYLPTMHYQRDAYVARLSTPENC